MQWIRRQLRPLAVTVLVWLGVLGAWSVVAHRAECHEAECAPAFVEHDASAHAFQAPAPVVETHGDHCVLCHWMRTFRPPVSSAETLPAAASRDARVHAADVRAVRDATAAQPPLRSPPPFSALA